MGTTAERIRGTAERIRALRLELPDWRLPLREMGAEALREYVDFRCALERCKTSAKDEFAWTRHRIEEVKALGETISSITFPRFENELVESVSEEQERQRTIHAAVERSFAEFKMYFEDRFKRLEGELEQTAKASSDFKMVLFGATQTGKSTIREALTCGNGATIGTGSSSTTKKCHEYTWRNLHVWDTPGFDSWKDTNRDERGVGDEEREALERLETADIAVFLCKPPRVSQKERSMLRKIVESGRPYLILMNVAADIAKNYGVFKKLHKDRQITREANRGFIDDLLKPFPKAKAHLIPVHARACFFSRATGSEDVDNFYAQNKVGRQEIYALSNFREFRTRLTAFICGEGEAARRETIDRVFADKTERFFKWQKQNLQKYIDELLGVRKELEKGRGTLNRMLGRWTGRVLKEKVTAEMWRELETGEIAREWIENKYDQKTILKKWQARLRQAGAAVNKTLEQAFRNDLERAIENMQAALRFNADAFSQISEVEDHAIDGKKAMKRGGGVAGVGGGALMAAANWWNPGGWILGIGIALTGIGLLLGWLAGMFQSKDKKIRKLREQFDNDVSSNIVKFSERAESDIQRVLSAVDRGLIVLAIDNRMFIRPHTGPFRS